jgi:hypothetical protein
MRFSAIAGSLLRPWHKNADIFACIRRRARVFLPDKRVFRPLCAFLPRVL